MTSNGHLNHRVKHIAGPGLKAPQSNDVEVDERGLVYLLDRDHGLDILEFAGA